MFALFASSSDPGPDLDSDPGGAVRAFSDADDPRGHGGGPGCPAEDPPAAGGDRRHLPQDPDASSPQPRPTARRTFLRRGPGAAGHSRPTAR